MNLNQVYKTENCVFTYTRSQGTDVYGTNSFIIEKTGCLFDFEEKESLVCVEDDIIGEADELLKELYLAEINYNKTL
jgi:hypothetical protein